MGDNTILVGSYTESILKAFGVNNKFTKGLIDASAGGKGLNWVLQAGTVAVKGFSKQLLALLANPVVLTVAAIVAAFAALVAVFNSIINVAKSNEEQYYKLEKAMTPIRAISDKVTVGFEKLADKVIKITSAILGNIAAFTDWIGLTNGLQKQAEKYADISEKRKNLMQDERNALVANAKAEKEIAMLRDEAADKQKYTFEERANLLEKTIKKEEEMLKRNENIAQRKLDLLKQEIENRGEKASTEELDALAQAEANLYEVQKHSYQRRRELTAQRTQFLKQAAQEQENINKNLQKSTIDLLEEGYEKQKALLILEYDKNIKEVKGNSDKELEQRKNLEKQKQKALLDLEIDFNREREKINIENRLNYVKEGSIEELDLRTKLLEIQKEIEIKNAEKTGADKLLIEQKYNNLIDKENEKRAKIQANEILNRYSFEAAARNSAYLEEKKRLSQQLKENKISRKDYDEQIYKLDNEFSRKSVEMAIESYKSILQLSDLSDEERLNATQKLADLEDQQTTQKISNNENYKKALKKWLDDNQEYLEKAMELFNQFGEFVNAIFDNRIQKIEEEQEAIEERYDKEVDAIESLADKGAISTEEAEARKRAAEERTAEKTKQLEKEKAKLQERQAIFQKGMNISNIIMDTSLAIMKAWSQGGIFAAPMVALIAALGAAQLATVIAQPIPKYAKGTDNHPGGPAIVGDGGKHELVMYDKSMFVTPNVPVLMNLPKGSKVIPNISDLDFLRGVAQSDFNLMKRETDPAIIFNNNNGEVIRAINETNKLLADFMKQMHKDAYNKEYQEYLRRKS